MDVNVSGTFSVLHWACHLMTDNQIDSQRQHGVIINTWLITAYKVRIGQVTYAVFKGATVYH